MTKFNGKYCWVDLTTSDLEASKKFYGELFGWSFEEDKSATGDSYWLVKNGDRKVAGLMPQNETQKSHASNWNTYFAVDSLDTFQKSAEEHGAKTLLARKEFGRYGSLAIHQDPTGVYFCAWEAKNDPNVDGEFTSKNPGSFVWTELLTNNIDRSGQFYSQIFDYKPEVMDVGSDLGSYFLFKHGEKSEAGLMAMPESLEGRIHPRWMNYVSVENCDRALEKATQLGAKTLLEAQELPGVGRFATIQDPQGATISFISE